MGKPMWIRHVLVPGLTDSEDDLRQMAAFIGTLKTVERVEILPYHTLGLSKWKKLARLPAGRRARADGGRGYARRAHFGNLLTQKAAFSTESAAFLRCRT